MNFNINIIRSALYMSILYMYLYKGFNIIQSKSQTSNGNKEVKTNLQSKENHSNIAI